MSNQKIIWKESLWKALLASLLFLALTLLQGKDIVRGKFEDTAFDAISKLYLSNQQQTINSPQVTVLTVDNHYMHQQQLYDADDNPDYGYIFPRKHLADFINNINERLLEPEEGEEPIPAPKALLIDFDLSFAINKENGGDKALQEALKNSKVEKILLVKTGKHHFIEESQDPDIQQLIQQKKIIFVSAFIHSDKDNIVRRYLPTVEIPSATGEKQLLPSAAHALWKIINSQPIDAQQIKNNFPDPVDLITEEDQQKVAISNQPNVNGTMIWLKHYQDHKDNVTELKKQKNKDKSVCLQYRNNWQALSKASLNCNLFDLNDSLFKQSIILLGGSYEPNKHYAGETDNHDVLDFLGKSSMSGIDIHANTLMTLLHLKQPMQQLKARYSFPLVFISFFIIDYLVSLFFMRRGVAHEEIELLSSLVLNTVLLFTLSTFLLIQYQLWFNWITPLILIELLEIIFFIKKHTPNIIKKLRKAT